MKKTSMALGLCGLLMAVGTLRAQNAPAAKELSADERQSLQAKIAKQDPALPLPKFNIKTGEVDPGFLNKHNSHVALAKAGGIDLLFVGDSITEGWKGKANIWNNAFGAYKPANFGISGDRTEHVLWRLENGALEGISPKAVVIMIGTNNTGGWTSEQIAGGVKAIVKKFRDKQPQAQILLLGVFPRGEKAVDAAGQPAKVRVKIKEINATIAKLDDGKSVHFLDIGQKFQSPDGSLSKEIMPDFLHLSAKGYEIWADAIAPSLATMLKK